MWMLGFAVLLFLAGINDGLAPMESLLLISAVFGGSYFLVYLLRKGGKVKPAPKKVVLTEKHLRKYDEYMQWWIKYGKKDADFMAANGAFYLPDVPEKKDAHVEYMGEYIADMEEFGHEQTYYNALAGAYEDKARKKEDGEILVYGGDIAFLTIWREEKTVHSKCLNKKANERKNFRFYHEKDLQPHPNYEGLWKIKNGDSFIVVAKNPDNNIVDYVCLGEERDVYRHNIERCMENEMKSLSRQLHDSDIIMYVAMPVTAENKSERITDETVEDSAIETPAQNETETNNAELNKMISAMRSSGISEEQIQRIIKEYKGV